MVAQRTEPVLIQRRLEPPRAPGGKGVRGCASARSVCCGGIPERGAPVLRGLIGPQRSQRDTEKAHTDSVHSVSSVVIFFGFGELPGGLFEPLRPPRGTVNFCSTVVLSVVHD